MKKTDALIIGAGPTGLFTAHQLKLIGLDCEVVDNLDKIGGQCIELYPDKPIYDIPAVPECTGEELTNNLINQLKPFDIKFHLNERVDEVKRDDDNSEILKNRIVIYNKDTLPVLKYYKNLNKLHSINGMQSVERVSKDIHKILT